MGHGNMFYQIFDFFRVCWILHNVDHFDKISLRRGCVFIVDFQFDNRFVFSVWLSSSEFS